MIVQSMDPNKPTSKINNEMEEGFWTLLNWPPSLINKVSPSCPNNSKYNKQRLMGWRFMRTMVNLSIRILSSGVPFKSKKSEAPFPDAHGELTFAFWQILHRMPCGPILTQGNSCLHEHLAFEAKSLSWSVVLLAMAVGQDQGHGRICKT